MCQHVFEVAERLEEELGEERASLIEGSPEDWEQLPIPHGPLTVGLDGAFVRSRHNRGCFEAIVGKSVLEFRREDPDDPGLAKSTKRFGFVRTYSHWQFLPVLLGWKKKATIHANPQRKSDRAL